MTDALIASTSAAWSSPLRATHRTFLEVPRIAVVGTTRPDGSPHQAAIWYRLDPNDTILINSRVARHWSRDVRRTGRASLAILDAADGYGWLGLACEVVDTDADPARALADIVALHRHYHDGIAGPEVEASFAEHPRISFRLRPLRIHDHLAEE